MARQKLCKQVRDGIKVYKALSIHLFLHYSCDSSVKKMREGDFVYSPSLLYHLHLVRTLFGMSSLHLLHS